MNSATLIFSIFASFTPGFKFVFLRENSLSSSLIIPGKRPEIRPESVASDAGWVSASMICEHIQVRKQSFCKLFFNLKVSSLFHNR